MHSVKTFSSYIWQTYSFSSFSSTESNDGLGFILSVNAGTSLKVTLMATLLQKAGSLAHIPQLASWKHATIIDWRPLGYGLPRSFTPYVPYQCIILFSLFLVAVYIAKDNPKFSFKNKEISVVNVLIQATEIALDLVSATSAVALIVLGQPGLGSFALVFLVIQVRGRILQKTAAEKIPRQASFPQKCRFFLLQQQDVWFTQLLGMTGGIIAASDKKEGSLRFIKGAVALSASSSIGQEWAIRQYKQFQIMQIRAQISQIDQELETANSHQKSNLEEKKQQLKEQLKELQPKRIKKPSTSTPDPL